MSEFREHVDALSAGAARAYDATAAGDALDGGTLGAAARRLTRRRRVVAAGSAVAALATVALAVAAVLPALRAEPVAPAAPGDVRWQLDVGAEVYATPLVAGERAYVADDDGVVHALAVEDGAVAWTWQASARVRASVTTDGELLFVASDDHWVTALRDSGGAAEVVWRSRVATAVAPRNDFDVFASAPVPVDGVLVVGTAGGEVVGLDAASGDQRWAAPADGFVRTSAAVADGVAFLGTSGGSVLAIDAATGAVRWSAELGSPVMASPGVGDGVVVAGSRGTDVVGLDAATGQRVWEYSLAPSWAESSATVVDGVAFFGSSAAGVVAAVDVGTGEPVWESFVRGWPWARPAVAADGTVYATTALVAADDPWPWTVYALAPDTGTPQWQAATGPALDWGPEGPARGALAGMAIADAVVIVAGLDGTVTAFAR